MARKKKNPRKTSKKVEKVKETSTSSGLKASKVKIFNCDICRKTYKTVSSLNNHKKSKHDGRCWMCDICQEVQTSKHSHIRHMSRKHSNKSIESFVKHADEKEVILIDDVAELTDSAKMKIIEDQRTMIQRKDKIISAFKSQLLKCKKQIKELQRLAGEVDEENSEETIEEEEVETELELSEEKSKHEENDDDGHGDGGSIGHEPSFDFDDQEDQHEDKQDKRSDTNTNASEFVIPFPHEVVSEEVVY